MLLLLLGAAALVILLVSYRQAVHKHAGTQEDLPAYLDAEIESHREPE